MPVTSQLRAAARPDDVVVAHWREAGLLKPSAVKPVIATVEAALILREPGVLHATDDLAVAQALSRIIGRD